MKPRYQPVRRLAAFAILATVVLGAPAKAGVILQDQFSLAQTILSASPVGQTFTAEDVNIASIAFGIQDINTFLPNGNTTMKLFDGVGLGGALLHTATASIPAGTFGLFDFDFTPVTLVVGNVYTAIVERPNARWFVLFNEHTSGSGSPIAGRIDYLGGDLIIGGSVDPFFDMRFRVTPAASVPEPSTLMLLGIGLAGLGWMGRRRKKSLGGLTTRRVQWAGGAQC